MLHTTMLNIEFQVTIAMLHGQLTFQIIQGIIIYRLQILTIKVNQWEELIDFIIKGMDNSNF